MVYSFSQLCVPEMFVKQSNICGGHVCPNYRTATVRVEDALVGCQTINRWIKWNRKQKSHFQFNSSFSGSTFVIWNFFVILGFKLKFCGKVSGGRRDFLFGIHLCVAPQYFLIHLKCPASDPLQCSSASMRWKQYRKRLPVRCQCDSNRAVHLTSPQIEKGRVEIWVNNYNDLVLFLCDDRPFTFDSCGFTAQLLLGIRILQLMEGRVYMFPIVLEIRNRLAVLECCTMHFRSLSGHQRAMHLFLYYSLHSSLHHHHHHHIVLPHPQPATALYGHRRRH